MDDILKKIEAIESRNKKVETDKAWEVSKTRAILISLITYSVALLFLYSISAKNIFLNAFVPVLGYLVSIQSLPFVKKRWIKNWQNKNRL